MKKRTLSILLTLVLLLASAPALAADAPVKNAAFYSDGEIILRVDVDVDSGETAMYYTRDGEHWTAAPGLEDGGLNLGGCQGIEPMGRGFLSMGTYPFQCQFSLDGIHWTALGERDWLSDSDGPWRPFRSNSKKEFQFVWTGTGYVMCQYVHYHGQGEPIQDSPRNTKITFLDEELNMTGEHDFGVRVLDVGYSGSTVYARVEEASGPKIYICTLGEEDWADSGLDRIPEPLPAKLTAKADGDVLAGDYAFRRDGDTLLCSNSGISFGQLDTLSRHMTGGTSCADIQAYACRDGVIVHFLTGGGVSPDYAFYPRTALDAACAKSGDTYEAESMTYAGNGDVIVRREVGHWSGGGTVYTLSWSNDGVNWRYADAPGYGALYAEQIMDTGRGFFAAGPWPSVCQFSPDGVHWYNVGKKDWLEENSGYWMPNRWPLELQMVWTGQAYMVRQSAIYQGAMGQTPRTSPRNNMVTFLDGNFDKIGEYDFGSPVQAVSYCGGTCYAKVETPPMDSGLSPITIISSADGKTWEETGLHALPKTLPGGVRALGEGDVPAAPYVFRQEGGALLVSDDGVYFAVLDPESVEGDGLQAACGSGGAVVRRAYETHEKVYSRAAIDAAISGRYPGQRLYAVLDGAYLTFDDPPYAKNQRVMVSLRNISEALGFTVEWVKEDGRDFAVCTKDGVTIRVEIGSAAATVNGEPYTLEAPSEALHDRTYVPIRFFSERFGLDVEWDQETSTVLLNTAK